MSYTIEKNRVVFDEAPREGAEVEIVVSTTNNLVGFKDPRNFYPRRVNEADTNRLAVNDLRNQHPVNKFKRDRVDDLTGEPTPSYNAEYPYNHVRETESGHIVEFDDTPGHERIHEYHRSGTFYEIHPDGTKVTKIVGDGYEIVHKNKKVRVRGNVEIYVDGDTNLYTRGNLLAQVDENMKFNVGKNIDFHAGQNIRMFANKSIEQTAQTTFTQTAVGNMQFQTDADMRVGVGANMNTSVLGDYDFITDGDYTVSVDGDFATSITGDFALDATGTYTAASSGNMQIDTDGTLKIGSGGAMDIDGSTVDLNTNGRSAVTITPIVPRAVPAPAVVGIAPALTYADTGDVANGIQPFTEQEALLDTDGFATSITAPKQAEVLEPKPFVALKDEDDFFASDDEEKTEDELRAAVESGDILPTSFSDYSYNALTGKINTSGASRRVVSQPRVPDDGVEHGEEGSSYIAEPEAAEDTASLEETPIANYDAAGDYIGGVNYNLPLSTHFNLGQLSKYSVVAKTAIQTGGNKGLTQQDIINNLKTLAVHVLDPIKTQYPNMFVTNAYRGKSTASQHNIGQAADLQFSGVAKSEYYAIAQWIRENVPHDQLLLEFKNTGSGLPWIHISLKDSGNRAQIMTFYNHRRYGEVGKFYQLA